MGERDDHRLRDVTLDACGGWDGSLKHCLAMETLLKQARFHLVKHPVIGVCIYLMAVFLCCSLS